MDNPTGLMSSFPVDQAYTILSLSIPGVVLVAGLVGLYRSDRATNYALRLTARSGFHRSVKLLSAAGFGVLALALLTDAPGFSVSYPVAFGTLLATGGLLFGYANVELLASRAELREQSSVGGDDDPDSVLASWRRSEQRYKVWRCLLQSHHEGAYWAFFAVGVLFVPGGFAALYLNTLLGLIFLVYMWALGLVSFIAAVTAAYRVGYELNCDDVEGLEAAVDDVRSRT